MLAPDTVDRLILALTDSGKRKLRIEYDIEYGADRRRGWSVSVDGVVCVQFAFTLISALVLAKRVVSGWESKGGSDGER